MPQPLLRVRQECSLILCNAGDRPLRHNPRLGLLAMESIISWSNVESFFLRTYIELLGGNKEDAADIYLALETQSAKTSAINTIANKKYSGDNLKVFRAVLSISKTSQGNRDKLAHWIWGYSPDMPDAFLLANPKSLTSRELDRSAIFVYKEKDFTDMIRLNDHICGWGSDLRYLVNGNPDSKQVFERLCKVPEIREKLNLQA